MNRLFISNEAKYRLLRTIIQGIIGVLIANLDLIVGVFHFAPGVKALIVALVMAILSPIMASMGGDAMNEKAELPYNYYENGEEGNHGKGE
jgi:multisubunit Na+/H+ antiporter MnhG subunit